MYKGKSILKRGVMASAYETIFKINYPNYEDELFNNMRLSEGREPQPGYIISREDYFYNHLKGVLTTVINEFKYSDDKRCQRLADEKVKYNNFIEFKKYMKNLSFLDYMKPYHGVRGFNPALYDDNQKFNEYFMHCVVRRYIDFEMFDEFN